jgi:hypothetical protein
VEAGIEPGVCANARDAISTMTLVTKKTFIELQWRQSAGAIAIGAIHVPRTSGRVPGVQSGTPVKSAIVSRSSFDRRHVLRAIEANP